VKMVHFTFLNVICTKCAKLKTFVRGMSAIFDRPYIYSPKDLVL